MSMQAAAAKLIQARKDLMAEWHRVEMSWRDAKARAFYDEYIDPVDPNLRKALGGMEEMAGIMDQAKRECGSD